jgi:hypothetical protein
MPPGSSRWVSQIGLGSHAWKILGFTHDSQTGRDAVGTLFAFIVASSGTPTREFRGKTEEIMDTVKLAAEFVAFTCFLNREGKAISSPEEASQFARENWHAFLPYTSEELGRFLTGKDEPAGKDRQLHHGRSKNKSR